MKIKYLGAKNQQSYNFKLNRDNGTDDYLFVLFKSPAMLWVENEYISVDNGACVLFDKRARQSYFSDKNIDFLHDFMHFDTETDAERMLLESLPKNHPIYLLLPSKITEYIETIETECQFASKYQNEILSALGIAFLYQLKNEAEKFDTLLARRKHYRRLFELRMQIYKYPTKKWSVAVEANTVFISRSHLQHMYKEFFGRRKKLCKS